MEEKKLFNLQTKENVLVSKCWTDHICRYHGLPTPKPALLNRLRKKYNLVFVCPEELGGLPVPRPAAPLYNKVGKHLCNILGQDVSKTFLKGAEATLEIAKKNNCKRAYLVTGSPACDKKGFAGELLIANGIRVINY